MAGRYVFAPLAGAAEDEKVLRAAGRLAKHIEASVEAAFVEPDNTVYFNGMTSFDGLPGAAMQAIGEARDEGLAYARDAFAKVFEGAKESEARFCGAMTRGQVSGYTRLALYSIIDSESAAGEGPFTSMFEDFLFADAAPVVVPRGDFDLASVGVAWSGSREGAVALKHALPILKRAGTVVVMQTPGDIERDDAAASDPVEALMWLQARGVEAKMIQAENHHAGEAILKSCAAQGLGLLVAGAYGHSRARELVFGGATRTLVRAKDGPSLLMAH